MSKKTDKISKLGYDDISPYRNAPFLDINTPQGLITMEGTGTDLIGVDNLGNKQYMKAYSKNPYKFEGNKVREIPVGNPYAKGGYSPRDIINYLYDSSDEQQQDTEKSDAPTAPSEEEIQGLTDRIAQLEGNQQKGSGQDEAAAMAMLFGDPNAPAATGNPYIGDTPTGGVGEGGKNPPIDNHLNYEQGIQRATGNPYNNLQGDEAAQYAFKYYTSQGIAPHIAAGMVGNLIQESGNFRADVIAGTRKGDNGAATGIAQWHNDRLQGLLSYADKSGRNPYTLNTQLDYVLKEATDRGDMKAVSAAKNTEEAANIFAKTYERPAFVDKNRATYAKQLYPYQQGGTYTLTHEELLALKQQGYKYKIIQ